MKIRTSSCFPAVLIFTTAQRCHRCAPGIKTGHAGKTTIHALGYYLTGEKSMPRNSSQLIIQLFLPVPSCRLFRQKIEYSFSWRAWSAVRLELDRHPNRQFRKLQALSCVPLVDGKVTLQQNEVDSPEKKLPHSLLGTFSRRQSLLWPIIPST